MDGMKKLDCAAAVLIWIAAFNWGLVGVFEFDLVDTLFESVVVDRLIYTVFGLASIYFVVNWKGIKERWCR